MEITIPGKMGFALSRPCLGPSQYKDGLYRYGYSYKDKTVSRSSYFIMCIPMPERQHYYIKTAFRMSAAVACMQTTGNESHGSCFFARTDPAAIEACCWCCFHHALRLREQIETWTKWSPFCKRHLQINFWKAHFCNLFYSFTESCLYML